MFLNSLEDELSTLLILSNHKKWAWLINLFSGFISFELCTADFYLSLIQHIVETCL